jgi:hypothetical protein
MESQINSFRFGKQHSHFITLFGYSSRSFPGLEIHGLGKYGKALREKIIYITRARQLTVPLNRYVIVCELSDDVTTQDLWFEFPILLLYWHLAQLLPIEKLNNCFAVGQVHPSGIITEKWDQDILKEIQKRELYLISSEKHLLSFLPGFNSCELLSHIPDIKWKEYQLKIPMIPEQSHSWSNNLLDLPR